LLASKAFTFLIGQIAQKAIVFPVAAAIYITNAIANEFERS